MPPSFLSLPARPFLLELQALPQHAIGTNKGCFPSSLLFLGLDQYPTDWKDIGIFKLLWVKNFLMHLEDKVVEDLFEAVHLKVVAPRTTRSGRVYSP